MDSHIYYGPGAIKTTVNAWDQNRSISNWGTNNATLGDSNWGSANTTSNKVDGVINIENPKYLVHFHQTILLMLVRLQQLPSLPLPSFPLYLHQNKNIPIKMNAWVDKVKRQQPQLSLPCYYLCDNIHSTLL